MQLYPLEKGTIVWTPILDGFCTSRRRPLAYMYKFTLVTCLLQITLSTETRCCKGNGILNVLSQKTKLNYTVTTLPHNSHVQQPTSEYKCLTCRLVNHKLIQYCLSNSMMLQIFTRGSLHVITIYIIKKMRSELACSVSMPLETVAEQRIRTVGVT